MRLLFIILFLSHFAHAQNVDIDPLYFYGDIMRNAHWPEHRSHAANKFEKAFSESLDTELSFRNNFDDLKEWVSIIYPADSTLRVVTWQVDLSDSYQYYGYVQFRSGSYVELSDVSEQLEDIEYDILDIDNWYGALYYDIVKFDTNRYLLLGYDALDEYNSRKTAEVLVISDDQVVQMGQEVFVYKDDPVRPTIKTRLLMEYSKIASVRLTYDREAKLLFFDNLIPVQTLENPGGTSMVQDGSYSGYSLKENGHWYFVEKLFHHSVDTPPRERPENRSNKDLFGKERIK